MHSQKNIHLTEQRNKYVILLLSKIQIENIDF